MAGKKFDVISFYAQRAKWGVWILILFVATGIFLFKINWNEVTAILVSFVAGHMYLALCQLSAEIDKLRNEADKS